MLVILWPFWSGQLKGNAITTELGNLVGTGRPGPVVMIVAVSDADVELLIIGDSVTATSVLEVSDAEDVPLSPEAVGPTVKDVWLTPLFTYCTTVLL